MLDRICEIKERIIEEADQMSTQGIRPDQMGELVDMIKDLCEAEKECLEACYYDMMIEDMGGESRYGYDEGHGSPRTMRDKNVSRETNPRMGYKTYKNQYGTFRGKSRNSSRDRYGYHEEGIENIREIMEDADPQRREQLKRDLEQMLHEM